MKKLSILTLALVGMAVGLPSSGAEAGFLDKLKAAGKKAATGVTKVSHMAGAALGSAAGKAVESEVKELVGPKIVDGGLTEFTTLYDNNTMKVQTICGELEKAPIDLIPASLASVHSALLNAKKLCGYSASPSPATKAEATEALSALAGEASSVSKAMLSSGSSDTSTTPAKKESEMQKLF